jgi:DNA polymerase III subunit epsilon
MSEPRTFVAIDFETADTGTDSACAVALVRVQGSCIVDRAHSLIRPPRQYFMFTRIHGISWLHVAGQPTFREVWPGLTPLLKGAEFLVAHNAGFDRSVLMACCRAAGLQAPDKPFRCTMQLARQAWAVRPTKLPDVCTFLNIPLDHHNARSDAESCARIMLQLLEHGARDKEAQCPPAINGTARPSGFYR